MLEGIKALNTQVYKVISYPFRKMSAAATFTAKKISTFVKSHNPFSSRNSEGERVENVKQKVTKNLSKEQKADASKLLSTFTLKDCEDLQTSLKNKSELEDIEIALLQQIESLISKKKLQESTFQFPLRPDSAKVKPSIPVPPTKPGKKCTVNELENYQSRLKEYKIKKLRYANEMVVYEAKVKDLEKMYGHCENDHQKMMHYEKVYKEFCDRFEEGDLIFFKLDTSKFSIKSAFSNDDYIDYGILRGQALAKTWAAKSSDKEAHSFIHVGILMRDEGGRLCIAEATTSDLGDDVRIVDFEEFALHSASKQEFRVERINDKKSRLEMTLVAKKIADEVHYDTEGQPYNPHAVEDFAGTKARYDKKAAVGSIFFSSKMDKNAKEDLLLAFAQTHYKSDAIVKERKFYCSSFVGFCLQTGQSHLLLEDTILDDFDKLWLKNTNGDDKNMRAWAKAVSIKHSALLDEALMYQYDSRSLSPLRLRSYIHANPDKFTSVGRIIGGPV